MKFSRSGMSFSRPSSSMGNSENRLMTSRGAFAFPHRLVLSQAFGQRCWV
jgi:hypothetical protein